LRLLLDEMYPRLIARELRARGHDAVSVHDAPGSGTADGDVLDFAREHGRAIVTENVRDYRPLAEALLAGGARHSGLVFTTERRWPRSDPGPLIAALDQLLTSTPDQPADSELWL
jgi:hypothetical protein